MLTTAISVCNSAMSYFYRTLGVLSRHVQYVIVEKSSTVLVDRSALPDFLGFLLARVGDPAGN